MATPRNKGGRERWLLMIMYPDKTQGSSIIESEEEENEYQVAGNLSSSGSILLSSNCFKVYMTHLANETRKDVC